MNGIWKLVVHTYMGDMRSTLNLTVDGDKLTGTVTDDGNGAVAPVENGYVNGSKFGYTLTIKTPVGEMTNELNGEMVGDTLKGKSKNAMGEFDFDAVRG